MADLSKIFESSFETELSCVTDQLTNVTIGDLIDRADTEKWDDVLMLIKERKIKKLSCDRDTLKTECLSKLGLSENYFTSSISKLINMGCLKEKSRSGKITYSIITTPPTHEQTTQNEDNFSDFVDFKRHVTDRFSALEEKIDKDHTILEMKDVVINLLKQELKNTQESLKMALAQNAQLLKNFTITKSQSYVDTNEAILIHDEINSHKECSKYNIKDQLSEIRLKKHNDFILQAQKAKEQTRETHDDKNKISAQKQTKKSVPVKNRSQVIVCGDSLLNNIDGNGISSKSTKAIVRNFPGANSYDMTDYIKPIIKKNPKYLILHVGTNDITSECDTRENLELIRNMITENSPQTELILSKVVIREDKNDMHGKVKKVNSIIENFCKQFNLRLINHDNITSKMLSKKKLHLNGAGVSRMAQNLKNYVLENC